MKHMLIVAGWLLAAGLAPAQERIAPEDAQKFARLFIDQAAKQTDLQLKLEPDPERAFGLKKDNVGALIIPDKRLTADLLHKAGQDVVPVAQFWVRHLTVVAKDQAVPSDKLRVVAVTVGDKEHPLPLFLLGARRTASQELELLVYGNGKEPLLQLPLRKTEVRPELPIEFEARGENDRAVLTLNLLGAYQAELTVAKKE
jgi:hypothetical protein